MTAFPPNKRRNRYDRKPAFGNIQSNAAKRENWRDVQNLIGGRKSDKIALVDSNLTVSDRFRNHCCKIVTRLDVPYTGQGVQRNRCLDQTPR